MTAFWIKSDLCIVTFWTWEDKFEWVHFLDRDAAVIVETTQVTHSTRGALFVRIKKTTGPYQQQVQRAKLFLIDLSNPVPRLLCGYLRMCDDSLWAIYTNRWNVIVFPFCWGRQTHSHACLSLVFLIRFTINMRSYWFMILILLVQSVVRTV